MENTFTHPETMQAMIYNKALQNYLDLRAEFEKKYGITFSTFKQGIEPPKNLKGKCV